MLEDGEGREDGEGEEVAEDAEDDAVDADVERQLRDHVVPSVDELRGHHRRVRPPPLAVPLPGRHPRRSRSPARFRVPVVVLNFSIERLLQSIGLGLFVGQLAGQVVNQHLWAEQQPW